MSTLSAFSNNAAATGLTCAAYSYQWAGFDLVNYSNQGSEGDLRGGGMPVSDTSNDHALIYYDQDSQNDAAVTGPGYAWLQAGFGVGTVDSNTSTYAAYEEAADLNNPNAVAHFPASLPHYNQFYQVAYDGETGYSNRGQYEAYQNTDFMGTSWMLYPLSTRVYTQIEGDNFKSTTETCARTDNGMIGTNGDWTSPQSNNATRSFVLNDNNYWLALTPGNFSDASHDVGPGYNQIEYVDDDAMDAYGGT